MAIRSNSTSGTVVGVFQNWTAAKQAVDALQQAGFDRDDIGYTYRDQEGKEHIENVDEAKTATGAVTGAAVGAGVGAAVGAGVLAGVIPVIGPAIAAGTLGVILTNAAGGAAVAGLAGALIGAGVSDEDAEYYDDQFQQGRAVVSVKAGDQASRARQILDANGASYAPLASAKRK